MARPMLGRLQVSPGSHRAGDRQRPVNRLVGAAAYYWGRASLHDGTKQGPARHRPWGQIWSLDESRDTAARRAMAGGGLTGRGWARVTPCCRAAKVRRRHLVEAARHRDLLARVARHDRISKHDRS